MNKKSYIISMIAVIILVAAGAFYSGMQYGANNAKTQLFQNRGGGNFGGGANGGQRASGQRTGEAQPGVSNGGAGDFASGQITAKDDTSITIKTRNGSSQIIFFSPSTTIGKSVTGTISDLSVDQQVTINGKSNSDGSIAAQDIQIRSAQPVQNNQ